MAECARPDSPKASSPRAPVPKPRFRPGIVSEAMQAKLEVGPSHDAFEREADAVADHVVRMSAGEAATAPPIPFTPRPVRIQRECAACEEEREELQRDVEGSGRPMIDGGFEQRLSSLRRRGGEPLAPGPRDFMETRFGRDLGHIRVHTRDHAAALAEQVRAKAFTLGHDIVFGRGQYRPDVPTGQRLLAHELTHTLQQRSSPPSGITLQRDPSTSSKAPSRSRPRPLAIAFRRSSSSVTGAARGRARPRASSTSTWAVRSMATISTSALLPRGASPTPGSSSTSRRRSSSGTSPRAW